MAECMDWSVHMRKRAVITGASGMIGVALAQECVAAGEEVLAICHRGSPKNEALRKLSGVEVLETDLDEYINLAGKHWEKKCDTFYHLAWAGTTGSARNDMALQTENIRFTLDAVTLAESMGCRTFVGSGSQAEYGRHQETLRPRTPVFPETGYGMAKLCAGQMSRYSCEQKGIRHIWARVLSVYGPYGSQDMITVALQKLMRGEHVSFTAGEQVWDYLYSEDAARALRLMAEKGVSGKTYVLGSGQARSLKEYLEVMHKVVCDRLGQEGCKAGTVGIGELPYDVSQVMCLDGDIEELEKDTGFFPGVRFEEGIISLLDQMILVGAGGMVEGGKCETR